MLFYSQIGKEIEKAFKSSGSDCRFNLYPYNIKKILMPS